MRIKIFVFPLALAITITIVIAYIWPEIGRIKSAKEELIRSQETLQDIQKKKSNIESLKRDLLANKEKEAFVLKYLPVRNQEEEIINKLNQLATDLSLSVSMISPDKEQAKAAIPENTNEELSSKEALFSSDKNKKGSNLGRQQMPTVRMTNMEVDVAGNYAAVKSFLEQIYKMEMFNKITSFSITKEGEKGSQSQNQTEGATKPSDTLFAKIKVGFGYMSEARLAGDYSAPIFSYSSFNFTPYENLVRLITKKIPALEVGSQGRDNPFLP